MHNQDQESVAYENSVYPWSQKEVAKMNPKRNVKPQNIINIKYFKRTPLRRLKE